MHLLQFLAPCEWLIFPVWCTCSVLFLPRKARVILFTVWHQICSSPKIAGVLTAFKKNKKRAHSGIFLSYGAAARAVQDSSSRCRLYRIHHTEPDSCARALTSGRLCRYDMPAPLWSYTTSRILHNYIYNSTYAPFLSDGRSILENSQAMTDNQHLQQPMCHNRSTYTYMVWYTPGTLVLGTCHLGDRY